VWVTDNSQRAHFTVGWQLKDRLQLTDRTG
jgi:hypothetical protein